MNNLQKSLKIMKKAEELKNPDVLASNMLILEEKVEEIKEIAENTRKQKGEEGKKGDKGERGEKGDRGEKGEQGEKGDKGNKGDRGERGEKGEKGQDGLNGLDGENGKDGKDGSPDTGEQIVAKINSQKTEIELERIKGLKRMLDELQSRPPVEIHHGGMGGASGIREIRAGSGISVTKINEIYTISNTQSGAVWGSITGDISNQTDLIALLDAKVPTSRTISTTSPLSGGGDLSANRTLSISQSNASTDGYLSSTDWNTFNNKLTKSSFTRGSVLFRGASEISEDNQNFNWDDTNDILRISSTFGSEVISNGTFTGNAAGWTLNTGWTYGSNKVTHSSNGTGSLAQSLASGELGAMYRVTFEILDYTTGTITVAFGGVTVASGLNANGVYTYDVRPTTTAGFSISPSNTARLAIDNVSVKKYDGSILAGGVQAAGQSYFQRKVTITQNASNGQPGTVDHLEFINTSGGNTHIPFKYGSSIKSAWSHSSDGNVILRTTGVGGFYHYGGSTDINGVFLITQLSNQGVVSTGGYFSEKVTAGYASTAAASTHNIRGSSAAEVRYIFSSGETLGHETFVFADTTFASSCSGTPSTACSSHANEAACIARDSHGGCVWTGGNCSDYNGTDSSTCTSGHTGCTWETASCGGFDQSTCESTSGCSWGATGDCGAFGDQGSCEGAGCSWNYSDCGSNFFDEESCNAQSGCSWNGSSCEGQYDTSCSGSYNVCSGSYDTGNCTGTWGACSGTPTCTGIDDSVSCGGETGCTWGSSMTINMPDITTVFDSADVARHYYIKKVRGSGDVVLDAYGSDLFDNGTGTLTISTTNNGTHLLGFKNVEPCDQYDDTRSTCLSKSGCFWTSDDGCDEYTDEGSCTGAGCTWDGADCYKSTGVCTGSFANGYRWFEVGDWS
jgi:hypothetical protein